MSPAPGTSDACPGCGAVALLAAGPDQGRLVCERCGSCWERAGPAGSFLLVDSIECPGCPQATVCESRPTWRVAELTEHHRLRDGTRVLVRPLLYSDRDELASGFLRLSPQMRRRRFLGAPDRLSATDLEYFTNLDYDRHFALVAQMLDDPDRPGVGVARYIRAPDRPDVAEVAVTVVEEHQRLGIATLLLVALAGAARQRGVHTFVGHVLWENTPMLDPLRDIGARISAEDRGVARVEFDLPPAGPEPTERLLAPLLRAAAGGSGAALRHR